jgi:hypothetical protein
LTRWRFLSASLLVTALSTLSTAPLSAQTLDDATRNTARSLATQGKDALDRADFELARDLFHRAYALVPAPTLAHYEGRALMGLGRLVEAEEALLRAVRTPLGAESPEAFREAVRNADTELVSLRARMPHVTITVLGVEPDDARLSVTLDERPLNAAMLGVEVPIDPGPHVLRAVVGDGEPVKVAFSMLEKQSQKLEVQPKVPSAPPLPVPMAPPSATVRRERQEALAARSWQKPVALASAGVGLAGLVTGVVTGVMAGRRYASAERACPDHACAEGSTGWNDVQSFRSLRTLSTVGYVVGGVGLAGGVTLYVLAPPHQSAAPRSARAFKVWLTAGSAFVGGAF